MKLKAPVLFAIACSLVSASHATFFNNASGLALSHQTIDFDGIPLNANQPITTQFLAQGVTFANAFANPDVQPNYPNMVDNRIGNFQGGVNQTGLFSASFSTPLSAVSFAMITASGTSTFQAFLDGQLVESATAVTSTTNPVNFYGFEGIVFDRISISVASFDRAFMMDSLQTIAAVPEPQTWTLFLAGLGLVGLLKRRHAASGNA